MENLVTGVFTETITGSLCQAGDEGPNEGEIVSPKRVYGAFDFTGLDERLKERGADEVVITGQHTHICVRRSSYAH